MRANVERGTGFMGRYEAGVESDSCAAGLEEELDGDLGHGSYIGRVLETGGIAVRSEDGDAGIVGSAEGLESLVGLLAVVESWGHAVDAHEGVGDEAEGRPLSGCFGVCSFDVAVDWGRR